MPALEEGSRTGPKFSRYGEGWVEIGDRRYTSSLIVATDALIVPWTRSPFTDLSATDLAVTLELRPNLVLLGCGSRQRFPPGQCLAPLIAAGIGWETMTTGAACRTFNVLAEEGRRVVAALILDD